MEKISRTKIVDLMKREDFGAMVNVKGWVRRQHGKEIKLFHICTILVNTLIHLSVTNIKISFIKIAI